MKKIYTCLVIIFLIVSSCVAFGRIAGNDFVNFDDNYYLTENSHIQSGINAESMKWAFTSVAVGNWHPLTWISHTLDWSLFGANASGHHLVSLLLHIGAVICLFLFLYKTTNNLWPAAFTAALFALHPLRAESVAWVSERKDVLSMFFGMATLYSYAFYTKKTGMLRYFLCLILFALALMSKPMLVTLPFVLMLLDYWPLERWQKAMAASGRVIPSTGGLIWEKIPFIFLTIASSILTFRAQNKEDAIASDAILPFITRAANAIVSYAAYLEKTFWPFHLGVFYPYNFFLPLWEIFISGIILIFITAVVLYYIKKLPFLFVGWFWYLGTLIPVIGLVQVGGQAMADRYTYLPSIGIAMMLAWGIPLLFKRQDIHGKVLLPMGTAVIVILAFLTWQQCGYWKNSIELFSHALQVTKDNPRAHLYLGLALLKEGKLDEAMVHYNRSIRMEPNNAVYRYNRGVVYTKLGQYQKAIEDYNCTIRLNSNYADAYSSRGAVYFTLGQYQKAIENLNKAIRIKPDYADAYNNRGAVYFKLGQYQKAIENLNEAIRLKPDYADAYNNRRIAYLRQNNKK